MNAPATAEKHLLGFAFFGWAWLVFVLVGRLLLWIVYAVLVVALVVIAVLRWLHARVSGRVRTA